MTDTNTQVLIKLKDLILKLLGEEGLNTLGKYEIFEKNKIIQEIPSIEIRYANEQNSVSKRVKKNSGIEAIIWEEPDIIPKLYQNLGIQLDNYYTVTLDNYHPHNGLKDSVHELAKTRMLDSNSTKIKPAIVSSEGFIPARALLYFKLTYFESPYEIN